jgi:hypothetical protein
MKYLFIALMAVFVVTGCKTSDTGAPAPGAYNQSSNDRHSLNRVSNNLRGNSSSFGH